MHTEAARGYGERIATLEERYEHLIATLKHLDQCVDDMKVKASTNAVVVEQNFQRWERRWWIGIGIVIGVSMASGSGTVSLKSLIEWLSKIH